MSIQLRRTKSATWWQSLTCRRRDEGTDGNAIATGHLLRETINPAQSSGQSTADRTSKQSYNALGEVIRSTDPAGNRIDTTYSTAGRVVLREVHTFASGFDTSVKSIETTYDGMGRLARARSLSSTSATLNDEVFAYDGWGNLSQTTVDADSAYDASSGTPPMVTTMTWTRNTTASGWQRLRQASVEQPGGASARYKVDGDTISQAMGRISHIQENLSGSGAVLADYRYMGASTAVAAVLPEPSIGTRLYPIDGGSADYDQFLDRFNRPIKNQWVKDYNQFNKPVFVEFLPAYDRGGFVTRVEDTKLGTGKRDDNPNLDFVRKFDQLVTRDALKRVIKQEEGQIVYSNATPPVPSIDVRSRQQIFERDLRGRVTRNKVDLNGNNGFADGTLTSADGGEVDDEREYFRTSVLVMRYVSDSTPLSKEPLPPTYDRNGNLTSDAQKHVYVYNPWCQLVEVRAFGQTPTVVLARYTYTATGQRVTEQYDHDGNGEVTSSDVTTIIASDTSARRVASFVNVGTFYAKETFFHHPPEIRGPGFAGGPLVRDRNDVLGQSPEKWNEGAAADRLERRYYATDWQGRVVSLVTAGGELAETYRYSATGVPFGIPLGDVNGDGQVDGGTGGEDWEQALYYENYGGPYDARVDLNLDGSNNSADVGIVAGQNGVATGRGVLSSEHVRAAIIANSLSWERAVSLLTDRGRVYSSFAHGMLSVCVLAQPAVLPPPVRPSIPRSPPPTTPQPSPRPSREPQTPTIVPSTVPSVPAYVPQPILPPLQPLFIDPRTGKPIPRYWPYVDEPAEHDPLDWTIEEPDGLPGIGPPGHRRLKRRVPLPWNTPFPIPSDDYEPMGPWLDERVVNDPTNRCPRELFEHLRLAMKDVCNSGDRNCAGYQKHVDRRTQCETWGRQFRNNLECAQRRDHIQRRCYDDAGSEKWFTHAVEARVALYKAWECYDKMKKHCADF